ncbi:hypothetical protein MJG53_014106 [Ovis ammon polii x Ovis aries]|uniref:Uncharacterized protein n=1 Tax=Ovis ammon polii x Ovis aries TaxID=2918886 RepID=A0ACB9UK76_9CETA|nr:hypothetical protein MJG53_014106 [Ovis ammon polii x Ovis aries]
MAEKAGHESRREPVSIYDRLLRVCVLLESLGPAVTADQAGVIIRAWRKDGDSWLNESTVLSNGGYSFAAVKGNFPIGIGVSGERTCLQRWRAVRSLTLLTGSLAMKARDQMCPRVSQEEGDRQAVQSSGHHSTVKGPLPYSKYIPGIKFLNDNTLEPPDNRSCKCCAKAAVQLWLPLNSFTSIRFHTVDKAVDIQDQSGRDGPRDCFPESGL